MSNHSPPPVPPTDVIKETTEKLAAFVQWIAQLIQSRNWFTILLLLDVVLLFAANPEVAAKLLTTFFPQQTLPEQYPVFFGLTLGLVFVTAIAVAVRTMPKPAADATDFTERKAIKGLRPFSAEDAEIFAQLQRNRSLKECLESITSNTFRFGILMGESGSGKTSFLQAGLLPKLSNPGGIHRGVYVKFADRHPIDTIRSALTEQLKLPKERVATADLLELLAVAEEAIAKPLILLFDQFEQFFVHHKHRSDRQPFIQALTDWYRAETLSVKIVVCIRGDMCDRLVELHQALGYSLGPQEVFRLEKFTPTEAAKVLRVIAETEDLQFDDRFVVELAEQELANREDGLISPVDLQILAWMIQRQTAEELRAFNRAAFQKFGGVEGLMTRFLERTLEARMIKAQREAAVKVLLALTDLERNVRAGVLTLTELQTKLQNTVKPEEVEEAASWLVRSDVRLITPVEHTTATGDTTGYELAHERIIPALMRLAGQELKAADRANQLLDRRVNEWLGNNRHSRYLLNWRELWLMRQQKPYLVWGAQHRQKAQLLRQSYRRIYQSVVAVALVTLLTISYSGWLFHTPQGQIQRVRWELARPLYRANNTQVADAAVAFAKDSRWRYALKLSRKHISNSEAKAPFLIRVAKVYFKLSDTKIAQQILGKALKTAQNIKNSFDKSNMLSVIAEVYEQLGDQDAVQQVLSEALKIAQTIEDSYLRSLALSTIAKVYGQLGDQDAVQQVLSEALKIAQILDDYSKFRILGTIAKVYGQLGDQDAVQQVLSEALKIAQILNDSYKSSALTEIIGTSRQLRDQDAVQQVLNEALKIAQTFESSYDKSSALTEIVETSGQLGNQDAVQQVLNEALQITQTFESPLEYETLRAIAEISGQLNESATQQVLSEVLQIAQTIENPSIFYVMTAIAIAYGRDTTIAFQLLSGALQIAQTIESFSNKSRVLSAIADAYEQLEDTDTAQQVLSEALEAAETADSSDVLQSIAVTYAKLEDWEGALRALKRCRETEKVSALTEVLTLWAEKQNPVLRELREEE